MKDILFDLLKLSGVSSDEGQIADYMFQHFKNYSDDVTIDNIGNVICKMQGKSDHSPIVIFAHMDEIGFIVKKIEKNGFLRFERIGGVNKTVLQGASVTVHGEQDLRGVIGTQSHHFMDNQYKTSIPEVSAMYIDVGCNTKDEVLLSGINIGNFATFHSEIVNLGNYITSKSMDNRSGCTAILKLQELIYDKLLEDSVYLVGCVMEEFNIRGVIPAIRKIQPYISIGIDITPACDTPDMDYNDICLGLGPALTYMNFHGRGTLAGVLPDKKVLHILEKICASENIPYQREIASGVITENAFIMLENQGIKVANISIPCRYTHTPIETIHLEDLSNTVKLLLKFICWEGEI